MKTYIAVMRVDEGVIKKRMFFETEAEAQAHVDAHNGLFVFHNPNRHPVKELTVAEDNTITHSPVSSAQVNKEADRRAALITFNDVVFDFDEKAQGRITAAAALAKFYLLAGGDPAEINWQQGNPMMWIAADNSRVSFTAPEMSAFGDAAAIYLSKITHKARDLKDMVKIPDDYRDDKYWT